MFISWLLPRKTASAVLIDMPNVQNEGRVFGKSRFHIVWGALRAFIEKDLRGTKPVLKVGFQRPHTDPEVIERWRRQAEPFWSADGYQLELYAKRDVDSGVSYHMYRAAKFASDAKAKKLRIILVSGDALFGDVFLKLKKDYEGELALELILYAWGTESLARSLALTAGSRNIRYLEQVPGLVRKPRVDQKPVR